MSQKLSRTAAAEFSFFLAVPTMFGATLKDLWDFHKHSKLSPDQLHSDIISLIIGSVIAFLVALLAVKGFISFLEKKGFKLFGIYRIIAGVVIIILYFSTNILHTA
jgi:undecaprenyl-diphosphatase